MRILVTASRLRSSPGAVGGRFLRQLQYVMIATTAALTPDAAKKKQPLAEDTMTWLGCVELLFGIGALALSVFLIGFFRFMPLAGDVNTAPSQTRLTLIPIIILLIIVMGFSLILRGIGYI